MAIESKIDYWLDLSGYDLDTAKAMLKTGRYLYVGFLCHQVVEKSLKAYYWFSITNEPPFTHNLLLLAEHSNMTQYMNEDMNRLINRLMPLNIQARYPQDKDELLKVLTEQVCVDLLSRTEEFFEWIKQLLKK